MKQFSGAFNLLLLSLFFLSSAHAQTAKNDTAFVSKSVLYAKKVYTSATGPQSHLYNGSAYVDYVQLEEEHPYYLTNDWSTGSIVYENQRYEDVSLMYNIHSDKVICENHSGALVDLVATKVSFFEYSGHTFQRFTREDDSRKAIDEGFYDVLYNGNTKLVVRRVKMFAQTVRSSEIVNEFSLKEHFYLVKNNTFYPIRSKHSVLEILGDQKQNLNQFIHKNKLKFKKTREESFKKLVAFYDTLNP